MGDIDPNQEWNRLSEHYRSLSDEELLELVADPSSLTEIAAQILRNEVKLRDIKQDLTPLSSPSPQDPVRPDSDYELPKDASGTDYALSNDLITVRRFRDLPEAMLAKAAVQSAGIKCYLVNENMVRLDWFISNLLGGVHLVTAPQDAIATKEILDLPIPESFEVEGDAPFEQPKCPKCGSLEISYRSLNEPLSYGSMFVGIPIPVSDDRWKCHSCGAEWQEVEDQDVEDKEQQKP